MCSWAATGNVHHLLIIFMLLITSHSALAASAGVPLAGGAAAGADGPLSSGSASNFDCIEWAAANVFGEFATLAYLFLPATQLLVSC